MAWSDREKSGTAANVDVTQVAAEIAAAVSGLKTRWQALGTEKAFDPIDASTSEAFQVLWRVAFDPHYDPDVQEKILDKLRTMHPGTIETMRSIGHASEWEMEKGYAQKAIEKAKGFATAESLIDRASELHIVMPSWLMKYPATGKLSCRTLGDLERKVQKFTAMAGPEDLKAIANFRQDYIQAKISAVKALTADFPYPTYEGLQHTEAMLMTMMDGLSPNTMFPNTHLIVEAGALPLSAIYSSISRLDGSVIMTNKSPQAHQEAQALVHELERLEILKPGRVVCVQADPLAPDFAQTVSASMAAAPHQHIYAATITQLTESAEQTRQIAKVLKEQLKIDPIITRDSHGLVKLLYEPMDASRMMTVMPQKLMTIPTHSAPELHDPQDQARFPLFMTYNSSRLFSNSMNPRPDVLEAYGHMFATSDVATSKGVDR